MLIFRPRARKTILHCSVAIFLVLIFSGLFCICAILIAFSISVQDGSQELNDIYGSDLNSAIDSRLVIMIIIIWKQVRWRETGERWSRSQFQKYFKCFRLCTKYLSLEVCLQYPQSRAHTHPTWQTVKYFDTIQTFWTILKKFDCCRILHLVYNIFVFENIKKNYFFSGRVFGPFWRGPIVGGGGKLGRKKVFRLSVQSKLSFPS